MKRIGLIGLGNIGSYYSGKLMDAKYPLTVLDVNKEKQDCIVKMGAVAAKSLTDIVLNSDIIILSLPNSEVVENIMDCKDGILASIKEGQLIIDTSTCRPSTAIKYDKLCSEKKAGFIDSPLTWRGAAGQILMVGGSDENFAKGEEILKCLSYKYRHVGPSGCGQYLKMINQAILANQLAVNCEAVEMSKKCQLDPKLLGEFLEFNIPEALYTEKYEGGGHLVLHYKDLGYLLEIAHDVGASIPISSIVHEIFKATKLYGEPNWFQLGIQTYYKRLNSGE
ncbi:MAG TPA: NAD(P)-dependent oxidoreductase [Ruminiclostridium sp.]